MRESIKLEFSRAFRGYSFWITLSVGAAILLLQVICENSTYVSNPLTDFTGDGTYPASLYIRWAGGYANIFLTVYLYVSPILAAGSHAITYYQDIKSGYIKNILSKTDKRNYLLAKYVVSFILGGVVFVFPMILNFCVTAAFLPAIKPFLGSACVYSKAFLVELAYKYPLINFVCFMFIYFIYGGAFACTVLAAAKLIRNVFLLSLFPFVVSYGLNIISTLMINGNEMIGSISPMIMLVIFNSAATGTGIFGTAAFLVITGFIVYYFGGKNADII